MSLIASTTATSLPALVELREPRADRAAHAGVEDGLEVTQGGAIAEDDRRELARVVGAEPSLELDPDIGVVLTELARDPVRVDRRGTELPQHARHGALPAADVAGQADHPHAASPFTASGWQCGQKWVLRCPTTMRSIRRPQRKHGSPVRR